MKAIKPLHIVSNKKQPNLKNFYFCDIFATFGKKQKTEGASAKKIEN